jgi:hypothetical protein
VLEAEPVLELVLDPVLDPVLVLVAEAVLVLDPVLVLVLELLAELDEVLVPVGVLVAEPVLVAVEVELAVEVAVAVTDCVGVGEGQLFLWAMISSPMGPSEYDPSFMPMLMHAITGSHADIAVFTLPFVKVCSVRGTFEKLLVDMRGGRGMDQWFRTRHCGAEPCEKSSGSRQLWRLPGASSRAFSQARLPIDTCARRHTHGAGIQARTGTHRGALTQAHTATCMARKHTCTGTHRQTDDSMCS